MNISFAAMSFTFWSTPLKFRIAIRNGSPKAESGRHLTATARVLAISLRLLAINATLRRSFGAARCPSRLGIYFKWELPLEWHALIEEQPSSVEVLAMRLHRYPLAVSAIFLVLALRPLHAWAFEEYRILDPIQRQNLSIYFVRASGPDGPAPLTLDQAFKQGDVKISWQQAGPLAMENVSDHAIYVPFGTLLKGGLQDQVVSQDVILGPRSGQVLLPADCVDPFRSTGRLGEDAEAFQTTGNLFPWQNARLSMLAGSESSEADQIRQLGVWWSIDTLRSKFSATIGMPLESPLAASWAVSDEGALRSRQSSWTASLVLTLENEKLAQALEPYLDALPVPDENPADIFGAVFAINGRIVAAELYHSNQLFMSMWSSLVRAYSTEALALSNARAEASPNISTVREFLRDTQQNEERSKRKENSFNTQENTAAISTEITDASGIWIHRGSISKLAQSADANTPDTLAVNILENGLVDGRSIDSLGYGESVLLRNDNSELRWRAFIARNTAEIETMELLEHDEAVAMRNTDAGIVNTAGSHFVTWEAAALLLNGSHIQTLNRAHVFSAEMPSTENGGRSEEIRDVFGTSSDAVAKLVMVAFATATGLFATFLRVFVGHFRRYFLFIGERSVSAIVVGTKSFLVVVRFASLVSSIYLQRLFARSRLKFRQFMLFTPMPPAQYRVAAVALVAFTTVACPVVTFASLPTSSGKPELTDSADHLPPRPLSGV